MSMKYKNQDKQIMTEEQKLIEKFGQDAGMRVPVGYFDAFAEEMAEKLPAYPEAPKLQPLTRWQRVRPYVYLAAMFAGIWCMMQMFHHISNVGNVSLEEPPAHIASLMEDPEISDYYSVPSDESDYELESEVSEAYSDMEEFEKDFGYEISPEYDKIDL